ncbi:MAG: hypothetical protein K2G44_00830 [Clostridia bacterium]|nr:hypothetical protein [Clostridia bacterium]
MDIGIKKTRMGINLAFILIFISLVIVCAIMWAFYQGNENVEYFQKYGVEVEAECVRYTRRVDENDMHLVYFWCRYEYENDDGQVWCIYRKFTKEENAAAQIGKIITITIDPNGNHARDQTMEKIKSIQLTYERDLILAIIFCFPVPIALYLLIYRGIYRSVMNYKISKKVGDNEPNFIDSKNYNENAIKNGEVTKVLKWIICYVKVKYQDESGATREKWAQSWFTHKEAKFLQQKKTITIVPYKNTYGILEEMQ